MGGGHRNRLIAPHIGGEERAVPIPLERQDAHAEHPGLRHDVAKAGRDGAKVLADHDRSASLIGPVRLDSQDAHHVGKGHRQIGTLIGRSAVRDHPETAKPEGMVDADAPRMREDGAQRIDERRKALPPQRERRQGGNSPILPIGTQRIGRGTDRQAGQQLVASAPAVRAVHGDADGKVGDQPDRHAAAPRGVRRVTKRSVGPPLGKGVEANGVVVLGGETGNRFASGIVIFFRPVDPAARPVTAVEIGVKRIEQRLRFQPFAALHPPTLEGLNLRLVQPIVDEAKVLHPVRRGALPVDQGRGVGHRLASGGQPDIAKQAARRGIGADARGVGGEQRVDGADRQSGSTGPAQGLGGAGQTGKVAKGAAFTQGRDLDGAAPMPARRWGRTTGRGDSNRPLPLALF